MLESGPEILLSLHGTGVFFMLGLQHSPAAHAEESFSLAFLGLASHEFAPFIPRNDGVAARTGANQTAVLSLQPLPKPFIDSVVALSLVPLLRALYTVVHPAFHTRHRLSANWDVDDMLTPSAVPR